MVNFINAIDKDRMIFLRNCFIYNDNLTIILNSCGLIKQRMRQNEVEGFERYVGGRRRERGKENR